MIGTIFSTTAASLVVPPTKMKPVSTARTRPMAIAGILIFLAANTSAKRYLIKLGKIIQLNLKTELLLLNKPPISNKIAVEIRYNPSSRKFEAMGVTVSSGEQSVDNVIMQTVNKALAMNLSMNTDSFAKLQGNPVLIIHL